MLGFKHLDVAAELHYPAHETLADETFCSEHKSAVFNADNVKTVAEAVDNLLENLLFAGKLNFTKIAAEHMEILGCVVRRVELFGIFANLAEMAEILLGFTNRFHSVEP